VLLTINTERHYLWLIVDTTSSPDYS
jgi:hypothetical protein